MIGYDFDGVLIPELHYIPGLSRAELVDLQSKLKAIFQPSSPYVIVTGRTLDEKESTEEWIKDNLTVAPTKVYYCSPGVQPALHKANTINIENITAFIESELHQTETIRELCKDCTVMHIDELFD